MDLKQEISEILDLVDAREFTSTLVAFFEEVELPNEEGYRRIALVFAHLLKNIPQDRFDEALWMAFWLGAAWQKLGSELTGTRG